MHSAKTMPKSVAKLMTSEDVGSSSLLSIDMPAAAAAVCALRSCAAVDGRRGLDQPARDGDLSADPEHVKGMRFATNCLGASRDAWPTRE
jgi:hypothetical protein